MQHFCLLPSTRNTLKYPNSVSMPIFPGEADCPFILYDLNCLGTDESFSHPSEHHPATYTSDIRIPQYTIPLSPFLTILPRLIQSVSSLCLTCPKQFNLSIWITKLTAAKPNSSVVEDPNISLSRFYSTFIHRIEHFSYIVYVYSYSNSSNSNSHVV